MSTSIILQLIVVVTIFIDFQSSLKKGVYDLGFVTEIILLLISLYILLKLNA